MYIRLIYSNYAIKTIHFFYMAVPDLYHPGFFTPHNLVLAVRKSKWSIFI